MNVSTRKATTEDLPTLLLFEQGIMEAERPFDPTLKERDSHYYNLKVMLQSPQVHLVVAEVNNQPVGCGYARIEESKLYLKHPLHGYLGFMYVVPDYRGQGINRLIMETLETWVRERGITELRLEVYVQNKSAIKAYEKCGFARHMIEMRKGLL